MIDMARRIGATIGITPNRMTVLAAGIIVAVLPSIPAIAANPFEQAQQAACQARTGLADLAAYVGMIGVIICLMLGYFNKLNWKWLSTGIGVSFSVNVVPTFVMSLAGGAGSC